MSEHRASLEVIAPTVEEAIAKGLDELGLPEEAVEVEILDSGSRGLFGLGSRQARVRLMIKGAKKQAAQPPVAAEPQEPAPVAAPPVRPSPAPEREPQAPVRKAEARQKAVPVKPVESTPQEFDEELEEDDQVLQVARATVHELLEQMKVRASVSARYAEPDEPNSRPAILVDVRGKDLSILIGPRAETLNALQYISGLIVSKELGKSVPMVVDVEGYRQRREQQIRQLARRMADQAIKTGRRQVLEPMPANERRLVHIELRSNPDVSTQSVGEEPRRKVTIIPEK